MSIPEQKSVRIAGLEDIPTIYSLAKAIWPATYRAILSKEQIEYMFQETYNPNSLRKQIENLGHTFLLLFVADVAAGFASFSTKQEAGKESRSIYKLHKLYVRPSGQRKGLGNYLMTEVSERVKANGGQWLDLNVNRHNPARWFYERIGFQILREEDIPIGPYWMNDYVMRKEL